MRASAATRLSAALLLLMGGICAQLGAAPPEPRGRPELADFMGLCGHYHFDGPTYAPLARHVRSYHSLNWDLDVRRPYADPPYPLALNRVNWRKLYGAWREAGFEIDASIMIGTFEPEDWIDPEDTAYRFGRAFAGFFGPAGEGLVAAVELGNEPSAYTDAEYTAIARAMARGVKEADPALKVATASLTLGESGRYARSIRCFEGWLDLVDVLSVHSYAIRGQWPDRRRTRPEDPDCDFLVSVERVLKWRDRHAPDKEVWVTEFGWDAHRAEGAPLQEGAPIHRRPSTVSRRQQAQYLARAYLIFARMGVDRAYMYWYMDGGAEAGLHNASGLITSANDRPAEGTRHPAWHALGSLRRNLGDCRFAEVLREEPSGVYAYRFDGDAGNSCVAFWSPLAGDGERALVMDLAEAGLDGFEPAGALEMALSAGGDRPVAVEREGGTVRTTATATPRLLFLRRQ